MSYFVERSGLFNLPASVPQIVKVLVLPMKAFFKPIPLDVTREASDLKAGITMPVFLPPLAIFGTVSTTTVEVSWAPSSANLSPERKKKIKEMLS